ncbi:MAG: type II toxin-antitoxin system prevent-host-death family antitoxin [Candidatus Hydrogenedentes bacterium]|nr:type II toxin-antitoxin system prevent-host-death family antitoxin [Candidatus Hydrogenedentota bacterium]
MIVVSATEAQSNLPELLERVAHGEEITIEEKGAAVAKLVRADVSIQSADAIASAIAELRVFCSRHTTGGSTIREMIEEGRRL